MKREPDIVWEKTGLEKKIYYCTTLSGCRVKKYFSQNGLFTCPSCGVVGKLWTVTE